MAFCSLPPGQVASLIFIVGSMSTSTTPDAVKQLIAGKDWRTLAVIFALGTGKDVAAPMESDLAAVGSMASGLQNANFVLAVADTNATREGKAYLQNSLDTHCWDRVARTLVGAMKRTGLSFTGADLKQAYAPNDNSPCIESEDSEPSLSGAMQSGGVVDGFIVKTLPDRYELDFSDFFTATTPGSFTDQFSEICANVSNHLKVGLVEFGDLIARAVDSVRDTPGPGKPR
jgi:hypothetical protein